MKRKNGALWAILCILVVLVLILAALLISGAKKKNSGPGAAAGVSAIAAAVGGGIALAAGGGKRYRKVRRQVHGGRPTDLQPGDIANGANALGFPADQIAPLDIQAEHHALRAALQPAIAAYIISRGAPIGAPENPPVPALAPAGGWAGPDAEIQTIEAQFGTMCDMVRGDVGFAQALPEAPWNNNGVPGPLSRMAAWTAGKLAIAAALAQLDAFLVDAVLADLPVKAAFTAIQPAVAALNNPAVPPPGAAPAVPLGWAAMNPAGYPHAGLGGANIIIQIRDRLTVSINNYVNPAPPNLRAGSIISTAGADAAVAAAIAAFDALAAVYVPGPVTLAAVQTAKVQWQNLRQALADWSSHIAVGVLTGGPASVPYNALVMRLGDSNLGARAAPGTDRARVEALLAPPVPQYPARLVNSRAGPGLIVLMQPAPARDPAYAFSAELDQLLPEYNAAATALSLDWGTIGPLERQVEALFAALIATYNAPKSLASARQSLADLAAVNAAIVALNAALNIDPLFPAAVIVPEPNAVALRTRVDGLPAAFALMRSGSIALPLPPFPAESANIAILIDPGQYHKAVANVGGLVRDLLEAVFRRSRPGVAPAWRGVRQQYKRLRTRAYLDPASPALADVERDAEAVATACFMFSNTANPVQSAALETARAALDNSLNAIDLFVGGEILVPAALKPDFAAAVARARTALVAIPILTAPGAPPLRQAPSSMLTESQKLINYDAPPTEGFSVVRDVTAIPAGSHTDFVVEASSTASLEEMVGRLPATGGRMLYGLVVDRPGDMIALYKAVAICLKLRPPPEVAAKVADRKNAATGWLYDIVRFESGAHYTRLHEYIKPELYAVDT
jgi:hypothetical protein